MKKLFSFFLLFRDFACEIACLGLLCWILGVGLQSPLVQFSGFTLFSWALFTLPPGFIVSIWLVLAVLHGGIWWAWHPATRAFESSLLMVGFYLSLSSFAYWAHCHELSRMSKTT
jgi:hypothetical protein